MSVEARRNDDKIKAEESIRMDFGVCAMIGVQGLIASGEYEWEGREMCKERKGKAGAIC